MTCKGCTPSVPGISSYYKQVRNEVIEDHTNVVTNKCYAVGVCIPESWVVPAEDADVAVTIPEIATIIVGAYFFHPQYQ